MLRPLVAQYYRRGKKSLLGCRRDFSSSGSNKTAEVTAAAGEEEDVSVMTSVFAFGVRSGFGYCYAAAAAAIFGTNNSAISEEIERDWEAKQKKLAELERVLERARKYYGITSSSAN